VIVEAEGAVWASHCKCNQWGLSDALFSNYFEDLFYVRLDISVCVLFDFIVLGSVSSVQACDEMVAAKNVTEMTYFPGAVLGKKYLVGAGPSSFGRQQRLSEITIEPITSNMWKS